MCMYDLGGNGVYIVVESFKNFQKKIFFQMKDVLYTNIF